MYPQSSRYLEAADDAKSARYAPLDPEWPPRDFVERSGEHSEFGRKFHASGWKDHYPDFKIADTLTPRAEDYVIRSDSHLHRVLKNLRVLHLFYIGFATNICLQHRDYGMHTMSDRGYNLILIRDCTTAVETHDTVDELLTTRLSTQETETKYAFSTSSNEFIEACHRAASSTMRTQS